MVRTLFRTLWHLPRNAAILLLRGYQQTLSPDHGPLRHLYAYGYCRHDPTCSMYTLEQIRERGFVLGTLLGTMRVLTCHPWRKPSDAKLRALAKRIP
ncbi:MAG: membrane protein insertion efficiency factor YidD [Candidatus Peribacteraceae bacterium]|nr:membrane protein insertion efficiency factor YidD [Candidatus Peribacteraceae bacterium]